MAARLPQRPRAHELEVQSENFFGRTFLLDGPATSLNTTMELTSDLGWQPMAR